MPNRCCVPNCKGNHTPEEKVHVFQFREGWEKHIPRKGWIPNKRSVVCEKHFHECDIIKVDQFQTEGGEIIYVPRKKPRLKEGCVPSIFPGLPHDSIWSFTDLKSGMHDELKASLAKWNIAQRDDCIVLYMLRTDGIPTLTNSVKISGDLKVQVAICQQKVCEAELSSILDPSCTLKTWSQLVNILARYDGTSQNADIISNGKFPELLNDACVSLTEASLSCHRDNEMYDFIEFITEQLALCSVSSNRRTYSSSLLTFARLVYMRSPSCYHFLLQSNILFLPHLSTFERLSDLTFKPGVPNEHVKYLTTRAETLTEQERHVAILVDDIHMEENVSFEGGLLTGLAENDAQSLDSTVQSFTIVSLQGNVKEVVSLLNGKNVNARYVADVWLQVLNIVQECGFLVVATIGDNNQINRKLFKLLTSKHGKWDLLGISDEHSMAISNPDHPEAPIFLLYNTVHILKCIRNNWLNQKNVDLTFVFPPLDSVHLSKSGICQMSSTPDNERPPSEPLMVQDYCACVLVEEMNTASNDGEQPVDHNYSTSKSHEEASFSHVRDLYRKERHSVVELAPLCYSAVYPSSLQRQKASLVLEIFNEKTISALLSKATSNKHKETAAFLQLVLNWWDLMNIGDLDEGERKRNQLCYPFTNVNDKRFGYLQNFTDWLQNWKTLCESRNGGCLSNATLCALLQTTFTMSSLIKYLLISSMECSVLTGKIQCDNIYTLFGKYRRLSGSNYSASVQQILESENLRVTSLLQMHSLKYGLFSIYSGSSVSNFTDDNFEIPLTFHEILLEPDMCIDYNDQCILVYLTGCVAIRASRKLACTLCKLLLTTDKELKVEFEKSIKIKYLSKLAKGGISYPTVLSTEVVIRCYLIFNALIASNYEEQFLQINNPSSLLVKLVRHALENDENFEEMGPCTCGKSKLEVLLRLVPCFANILMNNYSKLLTDSNTEKNKKRKLETLE